MPTKTVTVSIDLEDCEGVAALLADRALALRKHGDVLSLNGYKASGSYHHDRARLLEAAAKTIHTKKPQENP